MAKLVNPALFSAYFDVEPEAILKEGLIDPILNSDTRLFIDPLLLSRSEHPAIKAEALKLLQARFSDIVRLLSASRIPGDAAWKGAYRLLNLHERKETCLGYGGASVSGSSRPAHIRNEILANVKEIITLGEDDPYIVSLMGLFDDGVGPDTISDFTSSVILSTLCKITSAFCNTYNVRCSSFVLGGVDYELPRNDFNNCAVVLVPFDIVRELPFAVDWADVSSVVLEIQTIRDAVNKLIGGMAQVSVQERKNAVKRAMLSSLTTFRFAFEAIRISSDKYDANADASNFQAFRQLILSDLEPFRDKIPVPTSKTKEELLRIVVDIISQFRLLVEKNNLWEMLWVKDKPKRERAAQLLFFGVAEVFCKANNIDVSPETNSGGGPVDFKFSSGYQSRVLVEIKRSLGTVVHGYKQQLEIYKEAANTDQAVFLIVDVGGLPRKLAQIEAIKKIQDEAGIKTTNIEVVDAKRRISASKRET